MTRVATPKRAIRSRRSTAGSPKASNHKTSERQRRCSTKWHERPLPCAKMRHECPLPGRPDHPRSWPGMALKGRKRSFNRAACTSRAGSATVDDIDRSCGPRSARLRRRRVQYSPITRAFHSIRSNAPRNALAHSILQRIVGNSHAFADRIFTGPELARRGLADDDDVLFRTALARVEPAATHNGNAE